MHEAIYMAKEAIVRYGLQHHGIGFVTVERQDKIIKWHKYHECQVDGEPYQKGDKVYFDEMGKNVFIEDVSRTQNGGYVYWLDYNMKEITDAKSEESRTEAERKHEEFYFKKDKLTEEYQRNIEELKLNGIIIPFQPEKKSFFERLFRS